MALAALTRSGSQLQVGGVKWVGSGLNAYWLGLDDNAGTSSGSFPSHATITAAFDGMKTMGNNLVRAHTIGISAGTSMSYLTGYSGTTPTYNESNMDSADWAVYQAGLHGIRLMVPLTDNWNYYHSGLWWFVHQAYLQNSSGLTDVDGSVKDDTNNRQFFANTTAGLRIRALFKAYITKWLAHVNPYTGLAYKDDPTIAIVETGNEIYYAAQLGTAEWTQDIASTIKATAPNKLVADGSAASGQAVSTMPGLTASSVDIVGGHYYPQRASAGYTSQTFTSTDSSFPAGSARQQLAADATAATNANRAFILGEYPWTRSDIASWWSDIESNTGVDGDMAWSFIGATETHGGAFGSDDYPVHYPYASGNEATYAPALASHITARATGSGTTNTAIVSGGSLKAVAVNSAFVQGASLSQAGGGSNTARVSGAMLSTGTVEPFATVRLPGDTTWTQTAGPATSTPIVLMPGVPSPGTTVTYKQPNGTALTFNVRPHTIFGRDSNGALFPIRRRPYQGTPLDVGPTQPTPAPFNDINPTAMPTADMISGTRRFVNVMNQDFLTDVAIGGFTPKSSSPGSGSLVTGAAAAAYGATVMAYPSGFGAGSTGKSRPEKVLSVSNSCLNYNFSVDPSTGEYMCATVHYIVGSGSAIQTGDTTASFPGYYVDPTVGGRFMYRFRVVNGDYLKGFGAVAQVIANDPEWGAHHGEMDMTEGSISSSDTMETNWHPYQNTDTFTRWNTSPYGSAWHTVTYDWIPVGDSLEPAGRETVWVDGVKVGESNGDRISQSWRAFFAFQTGANATPPPAAGATSNGVTIPADGVVRGQLQVDWVSVYRPTTV